MAPFVFWVIENRHERTEVDAEHGALQDDICVSHKGGFAVPGL